MNSEKNVLLSVLIIAGTFVGLLLLRRVFFGMLLRFSRRTETQIDDILVASLRIPSLVLIFALTAYLGFTVAGLPEKYAPAAAKGIYLSIILAVTMALANVSDRLLAYFLRKVDLPVSTTSLLLAVVRAVVYVIGILIMLNFLGISITPIITALGVGGLAMALALQDTLSNLFAGIHIMAEQTIRVGDVIRLETGQEGVVEDISWRTTRIRMAPNNMVIVPNNKLSQSVITNYHLPERTMVLQVPVSVGYGSDPALVEAALLDEARLAAGELPAILTDPAPAVHFRPGFGPSSLDVTLLCHIREVADQNAALSLLNRRILLRFRRDNIELPFPTRTVYLRDERGPR